MKAAGAWLRLVAALGGSTVKLVPTRHQLMVTVPLPKVRPDQPITRIIDANVYVRPENLSVLRRLAERAAPQFPILRDVACRSTVAGCRQ